MFDPEALAMAFLRAQTPSGAFSEPLVEEMANPVAQALNGPKNHFYREMIRNDLTLTLLHELKGVESAPAWSARR